MVCTKCEKKLTKLVTPSVWKKSGKTGKGVNPETGAKTKIGQNMLLKNRKALKNKFFKKCKKCSKSVTGQHLFCNLCGYKEGKCTMCGVKIISTKFYKQSNH